MLEILLCLNYITTIGLLQLDITPIDFIPVSVYNNHMANIYSVNEAAQKLGLDPSQIRRLLAKGKIEGKKLGRDWVVLSLDYTRRRKIGGGRKPQMRKVGINGKGS